MNRVIIFIGCGFIFVLSQLSCKDISVNGVVGTDTLSGSDSDSDSATGADTDTDTDTDSDTDTDADGDTDSDLDTDTDTDADSDTTTEYLDQDSDGWISSIDCDDENPDANQGLPEIFDPPNGVDEDCDGLTDEGPGYGPANHIPETCKEAEQGLSAIGCTFYAVDSDLADVYDLRQFAIFVSNVQKKNDATVTVEQKFRGVWEPVPSSGGPVTIAPMKLHTFLVPDKHVDGSGFHEAGAYRITSTVPVVAYQVNPYEAAESFTSDATLLLQVPALDSVYYVLGDVLYQTWFKSYATVIASVDNTLIEVTPSAVTKGRSPKIPEGSPGVPFNITLDAGDVAQFTVTNAEEGLTGTYITSDPEHPIAVFSGNTCASLPLGAAACDHLHEQLSGVQKWGRRFVAARMPVRSTGDQLEPSLWQILASEDNTTIEFFASPEVTGLPTGPITLQMGESWESYVSGTESNPGDFYIDADKPIGLSNYMTGSSTTRGPGPLRGNGDPSQVQISSVEQYLKRYVLLVPENWLYDFLTVVRPKNTQVLLDDSPIPDSEFTPVGPSFEIARVIVDDGVHTVEGSSALLVIVVGIDDDDSYAYLGGTATNTINQVH